MEFDELLQQAVAIKASDLHLKVGVVPVVRINSQLRPLTRQSLPIDTTQMEQILQHTLTSQERAHLLEHKHLDKSYDLPTVGRFRLNIFRQRGSTRFVARIISHHIPALQELGLPSAVQKIAEYERGLVLVTGVTGSGKSTTLASMINHINHNMHKHIITLEDPIEFYIKDRKSIISQRELGEDMLDFSSSLRASLRQDPDVILVGEMRDRQTMETALLAAETGHLVLSTLHTLDATETINRIIAQFEARQQSQVRNQLAAVLKAVISQRLLQKADGSGMVPAMEIMVSNQRIKEMIADPEKTHRIAEVLGSSAKESGMRSFDQSLIRLVVQKKITLEEALKYTSHKDNFLLQFKGVQSGSASDWQEDIEAFKNLSKINDDTSTLRLDRKKKRR